MVRVCCCLTYQNHGIRNLFSQDRVPGDAAFTRKFIRSIFILILLNLSTAQARLDSGLEMVEDLIDREQKWLLGEVLLGVVAFLAHLEGKLSLLSCCWSRSRCVECLGYYRLLWWYTTCVDLRDGNLQRGNAVKISIPCFGLDRYMIEWRRGHSLLI